MSSWVRPFFLDSQSLGRRCAEPRAPPAEPLSTSPSSPTIGGDASSVKSDGLSRTEASLVDADRPTRIKRALSDPSFKTDRSVKSDDDLDGEEDEDDAIAGSVRPEALENSETVAAVESALQSIMSSKDKESSAPVADESTEHRESIFAYDRVASVDAEEEVRRPLLRLRCTDLTMPMPCTEYRTGPCAW